MLVALATLNPQPESVPINALVAVEGTPLEEQKPVEIWDMIRMVALNGTRKGTEQWMLFSQISLLVPGRGEVIQRTPKKGTGELRKSATRSDSYDFKLMDCGKAGYYIEAGCRWFTMAEAVKHWTDTRSDTDLGRETFDILDLFKLHITRLEAAKKKEK